MLCPGLSDMDIFYQITEGIRITARPSYLSDQSDPWQRRYVFTYRIRLENVGDTPAQLVWRHWYIHDSVAGKSEVEGEGVVGKKPLLTPGQVHEYESFCVLQSPQGHMEGYYEFRRPDGSSFQAAIPRFQLRVNAEA